MGTERDREVYPVCLMAISSHLRHCRLASGAAKLGSSGLIGDSAWMGLQRISVFVLSLMLAL
jgi:hypothetical protein